MQYVRRLSDAHDNPFAHDKTGLNIHEDIERGDNDTVKHPLGKDGKVKVLGV